MSILQLQGKDAVVRIGDFDALNCVSSFNWDAAMNAENLTQLGDENYDAQTIQPSVNGTIETRTTGSSSAVLSRMIYALDSGTGEFDGYTSANDKLITELDLERAVFDFVESKKANEIFDRSTLFPRATLRTLSFAARTDGNASETYGFDSDLLEIFRKPFHDLRPIPVTRDTATTPATTAVVPLPYTVESTSTIAGAAWKIYALDIDGRRVAASDIVVTSGTGGQPDKIALSAGAQAAGVTLTLGSRLALYVYKKTPGSFPSITYPTTARFVKADQIDIWLVDPTDTFTVASDTDTVENLLALGHNFNDIPFTDADLLLRVQSSDISIDLQREELRQIKRTDTGSPVFHRAATYPVPITVSMTAFETDLNDWAKLQNKNAMGSATPDILDLADFESKEWMIIQRYYKAGTKLQTLGVLDCRVDNPGASVSTGARSERTWSFVGSKFRLQGKTGV